MIKTRKRICPRCNSIIIYISYQGYWGANKRKTLCSNCRIIIRKEIKDKQCWSRECSCGRKIIYKEKWLLNRAIKQKFTTCKKCRMVGKIFSDERKEKIRQSKLHNPNQKETSRKMRISAQKRIKNRFGICHPNFNIRACHYFDKLEKEKMWNGKYATKTGEHYIDGLGYFVDYYEPNLNIVVEYDKRKHFVGGKLKLKDMERMNEIKTNLHCKFFRYNEMENKLKEY
jgi:hypothetical protein